MSGDSLEVSLRIKTENAQAIKQIENDTKSLGNTVEAVAQKQAAATKKATDAILEQLAAVKNLDSKVGKQLMDQLEMLDKVTAAEVRATRAAEERAAVEAKAADKRAKDFQAMARAMDGAAREDAARANEAAKGAAKTEQAVAQLARGTGLANYQLTSLANGASGLTGALGAVGLVTALVSAGLVLGGRAAFDLVKEFAGAERESANLAARLGITVQQAEKLQAEAQLTGVSVSSLEASARLLGEALEHPDEQGRKVQKSLHEMGISTMDLKGNMADLGPVVLQVLEKLSRIPNDAERAALAQETLGRGSKILQPLIQDYSELQRVVASLHIGEDAAGSKELLDADKAIKELTVSWGQFEKKLAEAIAPIVIPVVVSIRHQLSADDRQDRDDLDKYNLSRLGIGFDPEEGTAAINKLAGRQIGPLVRSEQQKIEARTRQDAIDAMKATGKTGRFRAADAQTKEGLSDQLKELTEKRNSLRTALSGGQLDDATFDSKNTDYTKTESEIARVTAALDKLKTDKKEANAQDQETIALRNELANLNTKELTGVDAINAKAQATVQHLADQKKLNADNLALVSQIANEENRLYNIKLFQKAQFGSVKLADAEIKSDSQGQNKGRDYDEAQFLKKLRAGIASDEKQVNEDTKASSTMNETDADAVRKGMAGRLKGNAQAVAGGAMSAGSAAQDDYRSRLEAAKEVFQIETSIVDQITDQGKKDEVVAQARKKYADEVYQAEVQNEESLQAQRLKGLEEYKTFFVGLVDAAMKRDNSLTIRRYMESLGKSQLNQIVGNIAGLTFDSVKKMAPTIGGQVNVQGQLTTLGKVLKGTLGGQDPSKNAAIDATHGLTLSTDSLKASVDNLTAVLQGRSTPVAGGAAGSIGGTGGYAGPGGLAGLGGNGDVGDDAGAISDSPSGNMPDDLSNMSMGPQNLSMPGGSGGVTGAQIGGGMQVAGGAMQAYQGFSKGGASGIASGVGGTLMAAAGVAALVGGPVGMAVGAGLAVAAGVADLTSAFLGNTKQMRENAINTEVAKNAYLPNTALNVTQGQNGTYEDFDSRGNLRTSTMSAVPTVAQPYITDRYLNGSALPTYYNAPGEVTSPYSGNAAGTGQAPVATGPASATPNPASSQTTHTNVTIVAMDSESLDTYLQKNHSAVGNALATHLQTTEGRASAAVRFTAGG